MKFLIKNLFFVLFLTFSSQAISGHHETMDAYMVKALKETGNHTILLEAIKKAKLTKLFNTETIIPRTLYAPDDNAFKNLPATLYKVLFESSDSKALRKLLLNHIFAGKHEGKKVKATGMVSVNLDGKILKIYKDENLYVKDMVAIKTDISVKNGIIHSVGCVMFVQPSIEDKRLDIETRNTYSITSCCLKTEEEVKMFLKDIY